MAWDDGLTRKQKLFVEYYVGEAKGNATEAARLAGYSSPEGSAAKNMGKGKILEAIAALSAELAERDGALTPEEIQEMWAEIARDPKQMTKDRLKALSDAARSQGLFIDRRHVQVESGGGVVIYVPSNGREVDDEEE